MSPAILAVPHTSTAKMGYHPHAHLLVSGGGIAENGTASCEAKHLYLIPVRAASPILRAKFRALMEKRQPALCAQQPKAVWTKKWNVRRKHTGQGETAVLGYLARHIHRIAITNARIAAMDESAVTVRYKERKKDGGRSRTLSGHQFIRNVLFVPASPHISRGFSGGKRLKNHDSFSSPSPPSIPSVHSVHSCQNSLFRPSSVRREKKRARNSRQSQDKRNDYPGDTISSEAPFSRMTQRKLIQDERTCWRCQNTDAASSKLPPARKRSVWPRLLCVFVAWCSSSS